MILRLCRPNAQPPNHIGTSSKKRLSLTNLKTDMCFLSGSGDLASMTLEQDLLLASCTDILFRLWWQNCSIMVNKKLFYFHSLSYAWPIQRNCCMQYWCTYILVPLSWSGTYWKQFVQIVCILISHHLGAQVIMSNS